MRIIKTKSGTTKREFPKIYFYFQPSQSNVNIKNRLVFILLEIVLYLIQKPDYNRLNLNIYVINCEFACVKFIDCDN